MERSRDVNDVYTRTILHSLRRIASQRRLGGVHVAARYRRVDGGAEDVIELYSMYRTKRSVDVPTFTYFTAVRSRIEKS